jgi:hypothetical protein
MRAIMVVILPILLEHAVKMALIQNQDMIETLLAN